MDRYKVKKVMKPLDICVSVPGSKSITNRALLMAAMAEGTTVLKGVQFSEDSSNFLQALKDMGFQVDINSQENVVTIEGEGGDIPLKQAKIYVGSAGTAARFLTAFAAMSDGEYILESSEQMKKRPMKELLTALEELGASFEWLENAYSFPMKVRGVRVNSENDFSNRIIELNIDKSSQFLSAMLMTAPLVFESVIIKMTGTRSARSYVEMTEQMMKLFGHSGVDKLDGDRYMVKKSIYKGRVYQIEPDVSAACYFYAMAAVTGGKAVVKHMRKDSLQGDMKFIYTLEKMGCRLEWFEDEDGEQLRLYAPENNKLSGIDLSMSDFSDQVLTLAAIAPFAEDKVSIHGVSHIRGQESDRIKVIVTELARMGIKCEEYEDGVTIYPGKPSKASIETYNDHRVAMSFAVTGLVSGDIEIMNPMCCSKTFKEYFEILDKIVLE